MRCKTVNERRWPWGAKKRRVREGQWEVRIGGELMVGGLDEEIRKRVEEVWGVYESKGAWSV